MLKASDGLLIELARRAGVRPPHVYFVAAYRRLLGEKFSVDGCAAFAMMDAKHIQSIIAVLDSLPAPEAKRKRTAGKSQLTEDWAMPEEWLLIARDRRFWPMDVCRTEADKFANWHRMKGNAFADWKAAWRNWIDGSHRESGSAKPQDEQWTEERQREYLNRLR